MQQLSSPLFSERNCTTLALNVNLIKTVDKNAQNVSYQATWGAVLLLCVFFL